MTPEATDRHTYHVQSLDRAFSILGCFSLRQPQLTLSEICELTGLPKPTVFRLLSVLEANRMIARTADGLRYEIGIRTFELGSIFLTNLSIERIARPIMERLSERYDMSCNLAILDDGQVVYVATTDEPGSIRYRPVIGYRHYVHCSALGKMLIAELSEEAVRAILERRGMPALSPLTITDPDRLVAHLAQVRASGYAMDDQEGSQGLCCLAVPIRDHQGKIVASISLSGTSHKFTPEAVRAMSQTMQDSAAQISRQLGWRAAADEVSGAA